MYVICLVIFIYSIGLYFGIERPNIIIYNYICYINNYSQLS